MSINYLDIKKIKNIKSSIKSEISFIRGKIAFLENTHLKVGNNIYKIDLIEFNKQNINNIFLKNLQTPNLNINKISLWNDSKNLNIRATEKKIDLSNLNSNKNKNKNIKINSWLIRINKTKL